MGSEKQTAPTFIKSKKICTSHMILGGFASGYETGGI